MPLSSSFVLFDCGKVPVNRPQLRAFAMRLREDIASSRAFTCMIARDAELLRLNRLFLDKDYPADVLSFPSGARDGVLGELAISVDRAAAQAEEHGHSIDDELCILMLHGVLHLSGLDHETDRGQMRRTETRWRKAYGLPTGLIERARRR
jgi:probable rRNA maturation factor